jgi:GNAT superfamily N-acetyltransferase
MVLLYPDNYARLHRALVYSSFNVLFAEAVLKKMVSGRVFVDDLNNPTTWYIVHKYGMSLLGGACDNTAFNTWFREYALNRFNYRTSYEWMQASDDDWHAVLRDVFGERLVPSSAKCADDDIIELNTRVNFTFDRAKFLEARASLSSMTDVEVRENTRSLYDQMKGSVVPASFWNNADDFVRSGIAFGLYYQGKLAAVSFSSFVAPGKLELGIETVEAFRGRGFAERVCAALIDYCLQKNLEPIWSCRLENRGSYLLAQKLGFKPSLELPYYRLSQ